MSFSSSCSLFLICLYSCGIFSIPISFHSLYRSQKLPKVKPAPTNPTQHLSGACRQEKVFYCLSSCIHLFTCQVYSLKIHFYLVRCWGEQNVSSSGCLFCFQSVDMHSPLVLFFIFSADTSKGLCLFDKLGIRTFYANT